MSNKMDNLETVWEGWLIKSPPSTRIWRAVTPRWRRRWFILRNSGELPGQYFLCYYTDRNCRKLKGQIDLDQCEQVDAGLRFENNKQRYQHMFAIKTPKRDYYLAAETEEEMNKWVDCVCHVCGLKPFITEDTVTAAEFEGDNISQATTGITEISPPVTPHTIITGPYIPISECISGKPINTDEDLKQLLLLYGSNKMTSIVTPTTTASVPTTVAPPTSDYRSDSYDLPRNLRPPEIMVDAGSTPPPSPGSESVFTDDESVLHRPISSGLKKPHVNWETFPRPSDSSMDGEDSPSTLGGISSAVTVRADRVFAKVAPASGASTLAPPRPPKPSHLAAGESQPSADPRTEENTSIVTAPPSASSPGGANIASTSAQVAQPNQDEMYDIPRSHQVTGDCAGDALKKSTGGAAVFSNRHCYSNAAPGHVTSDNNNIFRYDFAISVTNPDEVPDSPRSETGSTSFSNALTYSNLPSPSLSVGNNGQLVSTPPVVNRDLKPGRKWSDSTAGSNEPSPVLMAYPGPIIDRNKKPVKPTQWKKIQESGRNVAVGVDNSIVLASPPVGSLGRQKPRSGPSKISPNSVALKSHNSGFATTGRMHRRHSSSDDPLAPAKEEMQVYQMNSSSFHSGSHRKESTKKFGEIQYLDLDLESANSNASGPGLVKKSSENVHTPSTATVYKTVDFLKTEAFNRTRIEIEEERSRHCMAAESAS